MSANCRLPVYVLPDDPTCGLSRRPRMGFGKWLFRKEREPRIRWESLRFGDAVAGFRRTFHCSDIS